MIDDVLAALPAAITMMTRQAGQWTCLGMVERRDEADQVRHRLGPAFELTVEPFEVPNAIGGGPSRVRPRTTWELWARATTQPA